MLRTRAFIAVVLLGVATNQSIAFRKRPTAPKLSQARSIETTRPDIHIEFVNNCFFDVNFAWYETKCPGPEANLLFLNEKVPSGKSTSRIAPVAPFAGGRIYAWAAEGQVLPTAMSQDVFSKFMDNKTEAEQCGAEYMAYRFVSPPFLRWAAFAELTFTHLNNQIINDADVSMVDNFYLPVSWNWMYKDLDTPGIVIMDQCYNTSLKAFPDEAACGANGGTWAKIPATPYPGSPDGYCLSPNIACGTHGPNDPAVCSDAKDDVQKLIDQLTFTFAALQGDHLAGGQSAFKWMSSNRSIFPGQLWTCSGFQNSPLFRMAEMCGAINRGLCDLSALGSLSPAYFSKWTKNSCGHIQNALPESEWFRDGLVRNPYAYWLRRELKGTTYSFSQDEGPHGGNALCGNLNPTTAEPPDFSRITVCPENPTPAPTPAPGWGPCVAASVACCDPSSTPQQVCPGGQTCQACGGSQACECPSKNAFA